MRWLPILPALWSVFLTTPLRAHVGSGIAFDTVGRIYFCDTARNVVWRLELDGDLTLVAHDVHTNVLWVNPDGSIGFPETGYDADTTFTTVTPDGMAFRIDRRAILRRRPGGTTDTLTGYGVGTEETAFGRPVALAADSMGNLYVADYGRRRVLRITRTGTATTVAVSSWFRHPTGVAVRDGRVYVLERWGDYWGPSALVTQLPFGDDVVGHPRLRVIEADGKGRTLVTLAAAGPRLGATLLVIIILGVAVVPLWRRFVAHRQA